MSQYEDWCPSCLVSFPVGTKRCIHCGGRIARDRPARGAGSPPRIVETDARGFSSKRKNVHESDLGLTEVVDVQHTDQPLEEAGEETPKRRGLRAGMSVIWMVLLAAGYIWQNCAGPA
jgi:hypothetical protein